MAFALRYDFICDICKATTFIKFAHEFGTLPENPSLPKGWFYIQGSRDPQLICNKHEVGVK